MQMRISTHGQAMWFLSTWVTDVRGIVGQSWWTVTEQ